MVMANPEMYFLQDMGIKFLTNSKVRQPAVCTSETVRPPPYFLNAGFMASSHHVKSSGNIGDRKKILFYSLNDLQVTWIWTVLMQHIGTDTEHWSGTE